MSQQQQGPGWWQASDGRWYPPQVGPLAVSPEERRRRLNAELAKRLKRGARVESQTDYTAVLVRGSKPNHVLHLLLTVFTCGIWLLVWSVMSASQREHRIMVTVDERGVVRAQKV